MNDIDEFIEKYLELLPTPGNLSTADAEIRASEFLVALAHLTNYKHKLGDDMIKKTTIRDISYAGALSKAQGSNAETRKANAESEPGYIKSREEFESVENNLYTIKTYQEIFNNAHIFYRQVASGLSKGF